MPALQVRDFPSPLYEDLREYAAANHRSMAQQTIEAVHQMIQGASSSSSQAFLPASKMESAVEIQVRMAKREGVLQRAAKRRSQREKKLPSPAEMLAEARTERDEQLDHVIAEIMSDSR